MPVATWSLNQLNTAANSGVNVDYFYTGFRLNNSTDSIIVSNGTTTIIPLPMMAVQLIQTAQVNRPH